MALYKIQPTDTAGVALRGREAGWRRNREIGRFGAGRVEVWGERPKPRVSRANATAIPGSCHG